MTEAIEITVGAYHSLQFDIKEDGVSKDVSSYTITFSVAKEKGTSSPVLQKTSSAGIDMTDAATGTIYVELTTANTKTLRAVDGNLNFSYDLRFEVDSKPEVWHEGTIFLRIPVYVPE